ncbi:sodium-coupled monocarboxylate transporter 2 [Camelus ferus]|uniref:Sodium-coupled monocarboxylate transporter 2 n=1 Tax=Camelus ferus TaxID=419612 RepID=A0A8B8TVK0_CAMFR|nr:sodium-coupled monocarboxylate transporter 2 [Camelus ferus]
MLIASLTHCTDAMSAFCLLSLREHLGEWEMREHLPWEPPPSSDRHSSFFGMPGQQDTGFGDRSAPHDVIFATTVNLAQTIYYEKFQTGAKLFWEKLAAMSLGHSSRPVERMMRSGVESCNQQPTLACKLHERLKKQSTGQSSSLQAQAEPCLEVVATSKRRSNSVYPSGSNRPHEAQCAQQSQRRWKFGAEPYYISSIHRPPVATHGLRNKALTEVLSPMRDCRARGFLDGEKERKKERKEGRKEGRKKERKQAGRREGDRGKEEKRETALAERLCRNGKVAGFVFKNSHTFSPFQGGLKAVVWTDAFQMVVMVVGFLTVLVQGSIHAGGLHNVLEHSANGSRLNIFDFDIDPLRRHTFWTISVGGTFTWLGIYGVNQSTIQRCISCKTEKHAKLALYFNLLGLWIILVCAVLSGLIMYSHFRDCDPWTSGIISAPDQLMPYFVMEIFATMPGLPGLFVACAFSGTLSTVAASINALATVTFEDFVKCWFPHLSDKLSTWISKGLCLLFGMICTSMAVAASLLGGVIQAALSIHGMCGGPMLGLFSLGILFPFVNWKGALGGILTGITLSFWVAIGAFIYPAPASKTWPLPLSTDQCAPSNATEVVSPGMSNRPAIAETWYSLSYLYYSAVGWLGCMAAGVIISCITGFQSGRDVPPLLIRPVCNLFCFWSKKYRTLCWCGVQHGSGTEQENLEQGSTWKPGAEPVLQNGLGRESLVHVPGYAPKDKSHDSMVVEKITHF